MASNWFIEESMPNGSYRVTAEALDEAQALNALFASTTTSRLEMWSTAHAASPKGYAPAAFRQDGKVFIGHTLKMLGGLI